ncbi:MAG: hydantoinase/oxoprolinase family protein, partial [Nitrospinota bacterium]
AHRMADLLKIPRVIFPRGAGVLSAFGFLTAPLSFDLVRSHVQELEDLDIDLINTIYAEMTKEAIALLREAGVAEEEITLVRTADMRYLGQGFEVNIPIPQRTLTVEDREKLIQTFHHVYREQYGRMVHGVPIQSMNWRLLAHGPRPVVQIQPLDRQEAGEPVKGERKAYFGEREGFVRCPVYDRYRLRPGMQLDGPALIEERECTMVIGPKGVAGVDDYGNIVLRVA